MAPRSRWAFATYTGYGFGDKTFPALVEHALQGQFVTFFGSHGDMSANPTGCCLLAKFSGGRNEEGMQQLLSLGLPESVEVDVEVYPTGREAALSKWIATKEVEVARHGGTRFGAVFRVRAATLRLAMVSGDGGYVMQRPVVSSSLLICKCRAAVRRVDVCCSSTLWQKFEEFWQEPIRRGSDGPWTLFFVGEEGKSKLDDLLYKWDAVLQNRDMEECDGTMEE
jgi:hypothetical protein